jgi:two-component system NtrC family response regulator
MLKTDILIVDDDPVLAEMLTLHLGRAGYQATSASTLADGVALAHNGAFDVIFLDVQMPDGNGLQFFPRFAEAPSQPEIIIMTGSGDPDGAKKAIQLGAWSYLEKPNILREMLLPLTRALQFREEKKKINVMPVALKRDGIIGKSPSLRPCLDQLAKAAISDANLLITGETGTGKEVFARAVHDNSGRSQKAFVVVDCASLPETLIESTLFGHVKGAFTGADRTVSGLVKMAEGGTLFLDEIGEMPERIQKSLLRVLQERRFRPVGATREEVGDFRVIAATNRDLDQFVDHGLFRADLLYRLRSLTLHLPPLRERKEDIRPLARHFLIRLCDRARVTTKGMADELFDYLAAYDWPGNVRELQQTMEQVFANAVHHPTLFPNHLPAHIRVCKTLAGLKSDSISESTTASISAPTTLVSWKKYKTLNEADYLHQLIAIANGNIKEMCRISGLSRARLYQLLGLHGLGSAPIDQKTATQIA